jgi:hypothetical protein
VSFRWRLVLAAFYVLTAVVLALVIPLALTVERRAESDFRSAVLGDAAVLAARTADLVPLASANPGGRAADRVGELVDESARERAERTVVVDASGRVLADSDRRAIAGTSYATEERPELRAALFEGASTSGSARARRSATSCSSSRSRSSTAGASPAPSASRRARARSARTFGRAGSGWPRSAPP